MTRELFLHIGTEKTGTTSLQRFLKRNRELLAQHDILFAASPGNLNHMPLTVAAQNDHVQVPLRKLFNVFNPEDVARFRAQLRSDMDAELANSTYPMTIMSGEHCSSRLLEDGEVERLRGMLAPYFDRIRIVVYIRRQDDYLLSTYSTSVKVGGTRPLSIPSPRKMDKRYDHWELLSRWARIFGRENIICRKFEKASLVNDDIVLDFLTTTGIDPELPFRRPDMINESFDAYTLEFLRLFNAHVPRFEGDARNAVRENLVYLLNAQARGPLPTLPAEQLREFMANFTESNRRVAIEYFGGEISGSDDPLFLPRSDERDRADPKGLTVERAVEIAAYLWQQQQQQIDRLGQDIERPSGESDRGEKPDDRTVAKPAGRPGGKSDGGPRRGRPGRGGRRRDRTEASEQSADR